MSGCGDKGAEGKSMHADPESVTGSVVNQAEVGFKTGGNNYDANRPNYTEESVILITSEVIDVCSQTPTDLKYHVLELGAGTGKLTEQLCKKLPENFKYLATDQSQNFLDTLKGKGLKVDVTVASADKIPLPDNSVGTVVCAQSFHWFAEQKDLESIHRVMAPGGKLILIWNMKRFEQGWLQPFYEQRKEVVQRVGGSMKYLVNTGQWRREIDHSPKFKLQWYKSLPGISFQGDVEKMLANLTTISAYNALPKEEREMYLDQMRQAIKNWPGLDLNNITMPFSTELYVYAAQ